MVEGTYFRGYDKLWDITRDNAEGQTAADRQTIIHLTAQSVMRHACLIEHRVGASNGHVQEWQALCGDTSQVCNIWTHI